MPIQDRLQDQRLLLLQQMQLLRQQKETTVAISRRPKKPLIGFARDFCNDFVVLTFEVISHRNNDG